MKWKLVIFDLDGTLVNTIEDLGNAVNRALCLRGFPKHHIDEYKSMVGHGVRNLVWQAMPDQYKDDNELLDEILSSFLDYYSKHINDCSRPYEGMPELLQKLRSNSVLIAVASNKFQVGTYSLVKTLFPELDFCSILGGRNGIPLKPDPEVANTIIKSAGISKNECVMVGDSATDISTARAAGIESIAVTWGFRPLEAVQTADNKVNSVQELESLLLG